MKAHVDTYGTRKTVASSLTVRKSAQVHACMHEVCRYSVERTRKNERKTDGPGMGVGFLGGIFTGPCVNMVRNKDRRRALAFCLYDIFLTACG